MLATSVVQLRQFFFAVEKDSLELAAAAAALAAFAHLLMLWLSL